MHLSPNLCVTCSDVGHFTSITANADEVKSKRYDQQGSHEASTCICALVVRILVYNCANSASSNVDCLCVLGDTAFINFKHNDWALMSRYANQIKSSYIIPP
jgi:hypothetical protein